MFSTQYKKRKPNAIRKRETWVKEPKATGVLGSVWLEVLKFNKHCSTFVLFDKKFLILDQLGLIDSSRKLLLICADMHAISSHLVLHAFAATLM
jgi:hypothetical protein